MVPDFLASDSTLQMIVGSDLFNLTYFGLSGIDLKHLFSFQPLLPLHMRTCPPAGLCESQLPQISYPNLGPQQKVRFFYCPLPQNDLELKGFLINSSESKLASSKADLACMF